MLRNFRLTFNSNQPEIYGLPLIAVLCGPFIGQLKEETMRFLGEAASSTDPSQVFAFRFVSMGPERRGELSGERVFFRKRARACLRVTAFI